MPIRFITPLKECPKCQSSLSKIWTKGRKLQQKCNNYEKCDWKSKPFIPTFKPVCDTKTVSYYTGGNWHFELFDKYGYTLAYSTAFGDEAACTKEAKHAIALNSEYGPCTAVIWPPTVEVKGKLIL